VTSDPNSTVATEPVARVTGDRHTVTRAPGSQIGRYLLGARLGAGGMGEVWVATDPQLDREVAIKLVHPQLVRDTDISARMVREARAMAKVSHRAVIAIHDAGEADGHLFLAMELVRGRTLGALLGERSEADLRDWRRWLSLVIEAGHGLAAAHAAGVLHRDFKPDNVLVDERGRVCVGDFGLATLAFTPQLRRQPTAGEVADPSLTMPGALLGTPAYMSLEQLRGEPVDALADQFSFCVAAYEAVYGESPFAIAEDDYKNLVAIEDALVREAIRPPPVGTTVPASVRAILLRGLSASPAKRWPSLDALLAALAKALAPRASRARYAIAAAIAGIVVIGAAATLVLRRDQPVPQQKPTQARNLGAVPLHAALAMSPSGRLAIGTDRVEVHDVDYKTSRSTEAGTEGLVWGLQFVSESELRWSLTEHIGTTGVTAHWDLRDGGGRAVVPNPWPGRWLASIVDGEIVGLEGRDSLNPYTSIALVAGERTLRTWPVDVAWHNNVAVSPSRRRFAFASGDRFAAQIVVADASDRTWQSPLINDLTAFAWLDERTLIYATFDDPNIMAVDVDRTTPSRLFYRAGPRFVGRIAASQAAIAYMQVEPRMRVRVFDRDPASVRDLDPSVEAELGWTADGSYVTVRATGAVERVARDGVHTALPVHIDDEPQNATMAGSLVLVAVRAVGGRKLMAIDLATATTVWDDPPGFSVVARCANDLGPPCFIARRTGGPSAPFELVPLDPTTGRTTGAAIYKGPVEDFAVSPDGRRVLVTQGGIALLEVNDHGERIGMVDLKYPFTIVRSVAYDPRGGILITGSTSIGNYVVGHYDGTQFTKLGTADGELFAMVRASPVDGQVLANARTYTASLWRIDRK
jgi:hypothetical protein